MRYGAGLIRLGGLLGVALLFLPAPRPAAPYVDGAPASLGSLCAVSTHITVAKVEKFSAEKRVVIYRKVADLKGQYPRDTIKHALGPTHGNKPDLLQSTQIGKTAII